MSRDRKEDGFYSPYVPARFHAAETVALFPGGSLTLHLQHEQHEFPESRSCITEFQGCVFEARDEYPVALVDWLVLECGSAESWSEILDAVSDFDEQFVEWIGLLSRTALSPPPTIRAEERLMSLGRLEVRRDTAGRGLGASIGLGLMRLMEQRCGVILATIKPFPLQFEGCSRHGGVDMPALSMSRRKLFEHYMKSWNAEPIDGASHLLVPLQGDRIDTVAGNWLLV